MNLIMAKVGQWDGPPLILTELSHQMFVSIALEAAMDI